MSMLLLTWLLPVSLAAGLLIIATGRKVLFLKPRTYAEAATGLLIASLPFTLATPFTLITKVGIITLQLLLLLLASRLLFGRLDKPFVYPSTRINTFIAFGGILLVCCAWLVAVQFPGILGGYDWRWMVLLGIVLGVQIVFLRQLLWSFKHYRLKLGGTKRTLKELPTVSVCIPARNENHALEDCLTSVLNSTYPKLEVLVLDDCSQDKTSEIIRSFAHDGVRFIQGDTPADGWLGKNQAMQTLADQATGDYLLFMDVDTTLSTSSIAQLVNYTLDTKMEMVAVLPQNRLSLKPGALFGTLRYFWQMVLPITKRRVSTAEQAWIIKAGTLKSLGSFKSVAHKIVPETTFARHLFSSNTYRFIAGSPEFSITTAKKWSSEADSALRILYPTYHRQPAIAFGAIACIGLLEFAPFALLGWLVLLGQFTWLTAFSAAVCVFLLINDALVLKRSHPRVWALATLMLPIVSLQEMILILLSMLNYEFGEVTWKGRNVCYPVILSEQTRPAQPALPPRRRS